MLKIVEIAWNFNLEHVKKLPDIKELNVFPVIFVLHHYE